MTLYLENVDWYHEIDHYMVGLNQIKRDGFYNLGIIDTRYQDSGERNVHHAYALTALITDFYLEVPVGLISHVTGMDYDAVCDVVDALVDYNMQIKEKLEARMDEGGSIDLKDAEQMLKSFVERLDDDILLMCEDMGRVGNVWTRINRHMEPAFLASCLFSTMNTILLFDVPRRLYIEMLDMSPAEADGIFEPLSNILFDIISELGNKIDEYADELKVA